MIGATSGISLSTPLCLSFTNAMGGTEKLTGVQKHKKNVAIPTPRKFLKGGNSKPSSNQFFKKTDVLQYHAKHNGVPVRVEPWDGTRNYYVVFASYKELFAYQQSHQSRCTLHEIIYTTDHAKEMKKHNHVAPHARFVLDLDYEISNSLPEFFNWDADVVDVIVGAVRSIMKIKTRDRFDGGPVVRLECCREKQSGSYKFSEHLIFPCITTDDLTAIGIKLYEAIRFRLVPGSPAHKCIDPNIYKPNHDLRVAYAGKSENDPKPLAPIPITNNYSVKSTDACLLVHGDLPSDWPDPITLTLDPALRGKNGDTKSRRSSRTMKSTERIYRIFESVLGDKTNHYQWSGAKVVKLLDVSVGGSNVTHSAIVGFDRLGKTRSCPMKTTHRGGCGQRWQMRVVNNRVIESRCFDNGEKRKCSRKWSPVLDARGNRITVQ